MMMTILSSSLSLSLSLTCILHCCTMQRCSMAGKQSGGGMAALPITTLWRLGGWRKQGEGEGEARGVACLHDPNMAIQLLSLFVLPFLGLTGNPRTMSRLLIPSSSYYFSLISYSLMYDRSYFYPPFFFFFNIYKPTKISSLPFTWILFNGSLSLEYFFLSMFLPYFSLECFFFLN